MWLLNKLLYGLNILAGMLLFVSFFLPYMPPSEFAQLTLLSLGVIPLMLVNVAFALLWLLRWDKRFVLSTVLVLVSYLHFEAFYQIATAPDSHKETSGLKVMSYNVHLFNAYDTKPNPEEVAADFKLLLEQEDPDVLCLQEYYNNHAVDFSAYPYRFIHFKESNRVLGHAILSKYPLGAKGSLDFGNTANNTIFADVLIGGDTLRVYNAHLQSIGIVPQASWEVQGGAQGISARMENAFNQQEQQVQAINLHRNSTTLAHVITGDFNNTVFSHTYQQLKQGLNDAFQKQGDGLGATYDFNGYPMRIDYILADPKWEVRAFKTIDRTFSDHRAIMAQLSIGAQAVN
ncbi:MAG: endonuclease/exonuclease/phosphatase family protein [Flavobacteriaceae bacterium]